MVVPILECYRQHPRRIPGTSLVVQWLRLHLPMQEMWVQSLAGELRSNMPRGQKKPKHKTKAIL